jgi:ribosomal protein S18 acetylase RimI-like enzyme
MTKYTTTQKYVRIQGRENAYRTGMPVGIFAAVHRLQEAGLLTDKERAVYHEIDQVWFQENLPNPPFYDDDKPGKPITWFKTATTGYMIEKLKPLMGMLEKYGKPYDNVYTNFPGRIVYEDEWQVAVYSDNAPGRISLLSVEHLPMYAEVIRQSFTTVAENFKLTKENCPTHTSFITNERLKDKIKDGYYSFGYFANGKLVGFVSLTDMGGGVYELNNLAILPEVRHFGYGKALLDYCKEKVKELGGTKITIGIIEEHTILKEWYGVNGFVHTGTKGFTHLPFTAGYMEWNASQHSEV